MSTNIVGWSGYAGRVCLDYRCARSWARRYARDNLVSQRCAVNGLAVDVCSSVRVVTAGEAAAGRLTSRAIEASVFARRAAAMRQK